MIHCTGDDESKIVRTGDSPAEKELFHVDLGLQEAVTESEADDDEFEDALESTTAAVLNTAVANLNKDVQEIFSRIANLENVGYICGK